MLVATVFYEMPDAATALWTHVTVLSGLALFATDLHASCAIVLEWRGLAVLAKIVLLSILPIAAGLEVPVLIVILAIGTISSHLSRRFRHRQWLRCADIAIDTRRG